MYKQIIIVRKDIEMGRGKLAAQVSHASLSAYQKALNIDMDVAKEWVREGQKKVVLKIEGLDELLEQFELAKMEGIPCELIRDAGHTQIEPGTVTCVGIGPWDEKKLDELYGKLKLL